MVKVKNVEGSSFLNPPFPYSSWLDYWEKNTGNRATYCACFGCSNRAEHGAHVHIYGAFDNNMYIVPLCSECNNPNNDRLFEVTGALCKVA